jgi:GxxExxY protein
MGSAVAVAAAKRTQIFLQEDQKGRSFFGFEPLSTTFDATRTLPGRFEIVNQAFDDCSAIVIAACIEVHKVLGPGLLESIYEECLCDELTRRGLGFERQKPLAVTYKGRLLNHGYRADLLVEQHLLVEIKAVDSLLPIHIAQTATYLRLAELDAALLVNFNAGTIRGNFRRVFRTPKPFCPSDLPVKKSGAS